MGLRFGVDMSKGYTGDPENKDAETRQRHFHQV